MRNPIIATIAAAAIGLAGLTATPAAAWGEKEQNALALILGLGVAGAIIHEAEKKKKRKRAYAGRPAVGRRSSPANASMTSAPARA